MIILYLTRDQYGVQRKKVEPVVCMHVNTLMGVDGCDAERCGQKYIKLNILIGVEWNNRWGIEAMCLLGVYDFLVTTTELPVCKCVKAYTS